MALGPDLEGPGDKVTGGGRLDTRGCLEVCGPPPSPPGAVESLEKHPHSIASGGHFLIFVLIQNGEMLKVLTKVGSVQ